MKSFNKYIATSILMLIIGLASCDNLTGPIDDTKLEPKIQSISKYLVDKGTFEKKKIIWQEFYNSKGKLEKCLKYDENQNIIQVSTITYVVNTSLETSFEISPAGDTLNKIKTETIFNKDGNIESKNIYNSKGDTIKKIIFSYDSYKNVNRKETIDLITGKRTVISFKFTYNNLGQVVKRESFENGKIVNQQAYSYNTSNGIDVTIKSNDNLVQQTVQYNFNEVGKIISEYHLDALGNISQVYKYFYTYYAI